MSNIIQFPDRGALLARRVAEVEKRVEAWMAAGCPSWLAYSEAVARWVVDDRGRADMLRKPLAASDFDARMDAAAAELADEFLAYA